MIELNKNRFVGLLNRVNLSKSSALIIALPLILLALVMQVYGLWGWLSREGWIQYLVLAEVYILLFITLLYIRSILRVNEKAINIFSLLLIPLFYFLFSKADQGIGGMVSSLWYINLIISVIASAWMVVFVFGSFWLLRELFKQRLEKQNVIAFVFFIIFSGVMTYIIKSTQLPDGLMQKIWEVDKLRTIWFMFEPFLVLSFSLISIYLFVVKKGVKELKKEYVLIVILLASMGFEYMINGLSLVTARTIVYFAGLYCFLNLIENRALVHYLLISVFIILIALHLNYYSVSPNFFTQEGFILFLHNALIESIKMFIALYIFILGWTHVKQNKGEFRLVMVLVSIIAYTYTTQSQGSMIELYDIVAITAMLKITALYLIIVYGFYYFKKPKPDKHLNK